jgi:hypothetical protein
MVQCDGSKDLTQIDDKPKRWCSEHPSQSQIETVMAMTIITDSLLLRPKSDCDRGYDMAVKGASVVVLEQATFISDADPGAEDKG